MQLSRYLMIIFIGLMLQSCASQRMTNDLQTGRQTFESGDYKQAFCELLPLAVKGYAEAQYAVGYMYYYGYGTALDTQSGIFWMNEAAKQGYVPAQRALIIINQESAQRVFPAPPPDPHYLIKNSQLTEKVMTTPPRDEVMQTLPTRPRARVYLNKINTSAGEHQIIKPEQDNLSLAEASNAKPVATQSSSSDPSVLKTPHYTLQLFGTYHLADAQELQTKLKLKTHLHIWQTSHNGKDWYVLTYGQYPNTTQAIEAKHNLPILLSQLSPWVRQTDTLRIL